MVDANRFRWSLSRTPTDEISNDRGELFNGVFVRIAQVHRFGIVTVHQRDQTVDEIAYVLERTRLFTISVNLNKAHDLSLARMRVCERSYGNRFVLQRLQDEIAHDAPIIHMHSRSIRVENASDAHGDAFLEEAPCVAFLWCSASNLLCVSIAHCLAHALRFVVARSWTEGVHVAEVRLFLRMNFRITVDFAGRGEQEASADTARQT